jgi:hypothetical protein
VVTIIGGTQSAAIASTAFRRGQRWALYVLFLVPLSLLYLTGDVYLSNGSTWPVYLILIVVDLIGLLLPYRSFFPKQKSP